MRRPEAGARTGREHPSAAGASPPVSVRLAGPYPGVGGQGHHPSDRWVDQNRAPDGDGRHRLVAASMGTYECGRLGIRPNVLFSGGQPRPLQAPAERPAERAAPSPVDGDGGFSCPVGMRCWRPVGMRRWRPVGMVHKIRQSAWSSSTSASFWPRTVCPFSSSSGWSAIQTMAAAGTVGGAPV